MKIVWEDLDNNRFNKTFDTVGVRSCDINLLTIKNHMKIEIYAFNPDKTIYAIGVINKKSDNEYVFKVLPCYYNKHRKSKNFENCLKWITDALGVEKFEIVEW